MGMAGVSAPNDLTFGLSKVLIDKQNVMLMEVFSRFSRWISFGRVG